MILPVTRDADTAAFLDGTAVGEFRLRRSRVTGEYLAPQQFADSTGSDDLEWVPAAGTGTVVSWAVHRGKPVDGVQPVQSILAIVQLDEGPWWWTELVDAEPEQLREGLPVEVDFVTPDGSEETLPVWRPRR
jgi:uncharacterized OB-fold protein